MYSQSYIGFGADNFNGVHGILTNPANIADSRSLVDINLASASIFTTNSYIETEYYNLAVKDTGDFEEQSNRLGIDENTNFGALNVDVLGPSVMISLSDKHSIALSTRARAILNINNAPGRVIDFFETDDIGEISESIFETDVNLSAIVNSWIEYGATYARVLNDNKVHFFKGGVTLKYLAGYGSAQGETNDVILAFDPNLGTNNVFFRGGGSYNFSENFDSDENFEPFSDDDNYEFKKSTWGLGLDLGIVYEYRPNHRQNISRDNVKKQVVIRHKNTYKYKIGLSILDIGSLNYEDSREASADLNDIDIDTLLDGDFDNEIKPAIGVVDDLVDQRILLPTTIRADFDLKLKEKFYLNATTRLSLYSKNNVRANRFVNQLTVSPRFETKWLTAFSPITVTQFGGVQWGLGGRLGPVFLGSSGAISHILIDKQTRAFDVYAGIKIPIFHKTPPPPPEDDPVSGFQSDCNGCVKKDKKQPKKPLGHYNGQVK